MNISKIIQLDLARREPGLQIGESAVVGDSGSRSLVFELLEDGKAWSVPTDVRVSVAFQTDGGYSGEYDTMPDGTDAFEIENNRIRVRLIDQIMAKPGGVRMLLVLRSGDLRILSTPRINLVVSKGIGDVERIEPQYYRVRDLKQINEELARIDAMLKEMDAETIQAAARDAMRAAEDARQSAESVDADRILGEIARKGDDVYVEEGRLYLVSDGSIIGSGVELPEGGSGLAFDSGYVDEGNLLHLTLDGEDIEGFTPFEIPAGGAGAASVMRLTTTLIVRDFAIVDTEASCLIPFSWSSSVDEESTGAGIMEWSVNGSRVALASVEQGEQVFDIRPYLNSGAENTVTLKITDAYGTFRTLRFTITVTSFGLSWNLGEMGIYGSMGIALRLTPTGSGEKLVKVSVDEEVISETSVNTTGRTLSVTVPVQPHGAHTVKAWVEANVDGETLKSEPLVHTGAWLRDGVVTPVVGILTPRAEVAQFGTTAIRWFVVDPNQEAAAVELKVDGQTVNILEAVDRSAHSWAYKADVLGEHILTIACGAVSGDVALSVTELGFAVSPVTDGLLLDLDPAGHSNSEAGRLDFGYRDGEGVNHPLVFSDNFDWINGGFRTDADGVTVFVVRRGTSVTLDRGLFDEDCRSTGRNIKLIFRAENVRNYDARLMNCKSGTVGLEVCAQKATVSSQLETMTVPYYEGRKIEMDVCINPEGEDSLAWIDLKGIQSCPPIRYGDTDSWAQSNPVPLVIGSEDADVWIYRLKLYGNSLNRYEILDNHIADCGDPAEMAARAARNDIYNDDGSVSLSKLSKANPELRVIHIRAERMTTGKEDEVVCDMEIHYEAGGEKHHLIITNTVIKAQGTSSLEYILAALNLDADLGAEGCTVTNGLGETITEYAMTDCSIPVSYFNLKANVASSESANNVCLADEYNTWNPYVCAPKAENSRVRDTVEGHPCAVFFTSTAEAAIEVGARTVQPGETILYFVGDMNNSKKNFAVFGQDNSVYPKQCCVEVMNNTELPCRFKEDIGIDETWDGGNFEFRFPKEPTAEMKQAFTAMQRWVVSTDRSQATGAAFEVPVTYGGTVYAGDTAEYRAAKFRAEFENYFVAEAMDFHYLFTDEHCMTDNRAKNLFLCYEYIPDLEDYRWSVRCDYDNDTGLGNDNSGGLTFSYGLEDTDMVGDSWAFNAHDSVLWCNIRDLRQEELTSMHIRLAGLGAWDPDRKAEKWRAYQSAVCEALRAEDMHNKYFLPWILKDAAAYARKCYGVKEEQRDQFLHYQQPYKASQYIDVSNRADAISMRSTIDTASAGDLTMTGYSDMYMVVMYGNGGTVKVRAKRGTPTLIECPTDSLGDTETYIFSASSLSSISSLAALKPKFVLATTAHRLQELIVGSGEVGYQNLNLNQIGVGNNRMLRVLDLRCTPNLVTALDLSNLTGLEQFLAGGSGITGVTFAKGCPLMQIQLPGVSSLVALGLDQIESFLMDASTLTLLRVENCPGIDTLAMCKNASGLERGRVTGVDWTDEDASTIIRLSSLAGYDAQGKPSDRFVLTGAAHVALITREEIDTITAAFPELVLSYDEIVASHTATFANWDGTVLHTQAVRHGGYASDPIAAGSISTPVRASDVEHHYSYFGWDKAFGPITEDVTFTAQFNVSDRYYRVSRWLDEAQSKLLQEAMVIAHGTDAYRGADPEGDGLWVGWDAQTNDVVCDMDVHAVFVVPELPASIPQEYTYLYSNDPADAELCRFSAAEFYGILCNKLERSYFSIGDRIKLKCTTAAFADTDIILELRSYRHFASAERDGFAGPYFGMVGLMNAGRRINDTGSNVGGWPECEMLRFLEEVVYPGLPQFWRALMERILVLSSAGNTTPDIVSAEAWLTLESKAELGFDAAAVPFVNEVAAGADEVTFACYTDSASRIKKSYNGTGTAGLYWLRSPQPSSATHWQIGTSTGYQNANLATNSNGVTFGFCLRTGMAGGEVT